MVPGKLQQCFISNLFLTFSIKIDLVACEYICMGRDLIKQAKWPTQRWFMPFAVERNGIINPYIEMYYSGQTEVVHHVLHWVTLEQLTHFSTGTISFFWFCFTGLFQNNIISSCDLIRFYKPESIGFGSWGKGYLQRSQELQEEALVEHVEIH